MKKEFLSLVSVLMLIFLIQSSVALIGPAALEQKINGSEEHLIGEVINIIDLPDSHECSDIKYAEIKIEKVIKSTNNIAENSIIKIGYYQETRATCAIGMPYLTLVTGDKIDFYVNKINKTKLHGYGEADYIFAANGYKVTFLEKVEPRPEPKKNGIFLRLS